MGRRPSGSKSEIAVFSTTMRKEPGLDTLVEMTFDPSAALQEVLTAHGMNTTRTDQGISIPASDLIVSASVVRVQNHTKAMLAQLDVRATSPRLAGKLLIESFAGWGPDEPEAAKQAFHKFLRSSMHVLLAALVDAKHGADQVEWDSWTFDHKAWRVCMGPLLIQGSTPVTIEYSKLQEQLKGELLPRLSVGCHWLRVFFMKNGRERVGSEVLLDNLDWPDGQKIVDAWNWPDGAFSARQFSMLMQA
jgi:hypothetical protein